MGEILALALLVTTSRLVRLVQVWVGRLTLADHPRHVAELVYRKAVPYVMWADTPYEHLMIPVR